MTQTIDLNSDLGEGYGGDAAMLDLVTSANVACGFHAGDAETMDRTVRAAVDRGVRIGAQVSYNDREGFGRQRMDVESETLIADVLVQLERLSAVCLAANASLSYVKPHGALYNRILDDEQQGAAVIEAMLRYGAELPLLTLPHSVAAQLAASVGIRVVTEGFADRGYTASGRLIPREQPGALLADPVAVAAHATDLAKNGGVRSLCVHGDTPGAVTLARAARHALEEAGLRIAAFT
jgi:UPF0271 protein